MPSQPDAPPPSPIRLVWGLGAPAFLAAALEGADRVVVMAINHRPAERDRVTEGCRAQPELANALDAGRLELRFPRPAELSAELAGLSEGSHSPPQVLIDRQALESVPPEMRAVAAAVERTRREHRRSSSRSQLMRRNLEHNLDRISAAHDISQVQGTGDGHPAFVLAGGPSLPEALVAAGPLLGRGPVLAVDTAIGPAVLHDVALDFVCSVDPRQASAAHATPLRRVQATGPRLAFQPYACPRLVEQFHGPDLLGLPLGDRLCDAIGPKLNLTSLPTGGTVLLFGVQLAVLLGSNPIVLLGADFAEIHGQTHALGTAHAGPAGPSTLHDRDYRGDPVPTTAALRGFRAAIEQEVRRLAKYAPDRRIVCFDGGGAAIDGVSEVNANSLATMLGLAKRWPGLPRLDPIPEDVQAERRETWRHVLQTMTEPSALTQKS